MKTYIKYRAWLLAICCGVSLMAVGQPTFTPVTKPLNTGGFVNYLRDGAGVAWADYDNDGDQDLLMWGASSSDGTITKLYRNDSILGFVDVTEDPTVFSAKPLQIQSGAAAWLDCNGDGLLDFIAFGYGWHSTSGWTWYAHVYKNNGTGGFDMVDIGPQCGSMQTQLAADDAPARVLAVADYNRDGFDDVLIMGSNPRFLLFKNLGNSGSTWLGFEEQTAPMATGGNFAQVRYGSVAWGDYNNDGFPDILYNGLDDSWTAYSNVYTNNGDGTFSLNEIITNAADLVGQAGEVAWIDYDKDGYLDFLLTGADRSSYESHADLYHNNKNGTFTKISGHGIIATKLSSIAVGDLNKDGFDDLVIIGDNGGTAIYHNNAGIGFTKQAISSWLFMDYPPDITKGMVALADYDNDGWLDIMLTGNYKTALCRNLGVPEGQTDAVFEEVSSNFPQNISDGAGAFWGDYDNDGDLDLLIFGVNQGNNNNLVTKLYRNEGGMKFAEVTNSVLGADFPGLFRGSAAWFDYDNDGNLDLIVSGGTGWHKDGDGNMHSDAPITKLYHNLGADSGYVFRETGMSFQGVESNGRNRSTRYIAIADYNNDGYQDVLLTGYGTDRHLYLYKNNKGEGFALQTAVEDGHNFKKVNGGMATWGDYNKDGYQDFLFSGYENTTGYISGVYKNKGDGTFTLVPLFDEKGNIMGAEQGDLAWVDYDNDGFLDILITGNGNNGGKGGGSVEQYVTSIARLFHNNEGLSFSEASNTNLIRARSSSITCADLDGDGYTDIMISGWTDESGYKAYTYINKGDSTFNSPSDLSAAASEGGTTTLVDVDGDGDLDLFVTGYPNVALFENTGSLPIPPASPTDLALLAQNDNIGLANLSWAKAQGLANSPLRYNVFVQGTAENSPLYIIAPADTATGTLRVGIDNLTLLIDTGYVIAGLEVGTYVWGVQAINNGRAVSAFATGSFTINKVEPDNGNGDGGSTEVEKSAASSFEVFRNGESLMVVTALSSKAELAVYNFMGAKLWSKEGVFEGATEIKGLQQGNYIVALRIGNKVEVKKIVL